MAKLGKGIKKRMQRLVGLKTQKTSVEQSRITGLEENRIIGNPVFYGTSAINFNGKNNILVIEPGATLKDSIINFNGNDSLVYLSSSNKDYTITLDIYSESTVFFGHNNYFNGVLNVITSEGQNIIIGNDCLFSFGIWIRTADPHLIYDSKTGKRINMSRSIYVGDHVWLGQNALLLKGSRIGSGSIIAANCVLAGKKVSSNSIYAGNPAKKIKDGIYFKSDCVHSYTETTSAKSMHDDKKEFIYKNNGVVDVDDLNIKLVNCNDSGNKLKLVKDMLADNTNKNRFFIK